MGIIRNKARMNVFMLLANQMAYINTAHGSRPGGFRIRSAPVEPGPTHSGSRVFVAAPAIP
ncbi:hypothetical protein SAMN06272771_7371 [Streptomyces sp. Ag82_O1-12]|nr:hypothetical protein SAMN06272771_7371 [Streptomyces sp. Ag82_O1-12]SOD49878.1 hypothetical protein SAMN06272727_7378 [Streptomyces sp. Ag82_G6-1]